MKSLNPSTNEVICEYPDHTADEAKNILEDVHKEWLNWRDASIEYRSELFRHASIILRKRKETYARLITQEMGKVIRESLSEILKCANACDYYANHAAELLKDQDIPSDATRSLVTFEPLGVVLAIMPWNFPFWQVFRFAAPALVAGNAAVLKHASNVSGCALAIEEIFHDAGFPQNIFRTLLIPSTEVKYLIADTHIAACTLTGSGSAGSEVGGFAGIHLKKTVLELGGSDPFIILEDADMEKAVSTAISARMINQGQSCIAAKRFIVVESRVEEFEQQVKLALELLRMGDPMDLQTEVGPLARKDIIDEIHNQVKRSIAAGARLVSGGHTVDRPGFYFQPTILADVKPGMPVYNEETFGPVISIIPVKDEEQAIKVANDSEFGLGGSVWTQDLIRGESVARKIECGAVFVNGLVKSDPRLPFGGIKKSGYGRELGEFGILEFVNIKTIWIG